MNLPSIRYRPWYTWLLTVLILVNLELSDAFSQAYFNSPLMPVYAGYFNKIRVLFSALLVMIPLSGLCLYFLNKNIGWYLLLFIVVCNILKHLAYCMAAPDSLFAIVSAVYLVIFLSSLFILIIAQKNQKFNVTRKGVLITLSLLILFYIIQLNSMGIAGYISKNS